MAQITLTRKELYELIWSTPMVAITQKYKVSNNDLKKICAGLKIPLPTSSYWGNIHAGKTVSIPPLSDKFIGEENIVLSLRDEEISDNPLDILKRAIESNRTLPLKVPLKLSDPDVLIIRARKKLIEEKQHSFHDGLIFTGRNELTIAVAPENVSRSLLFMDTLIKLMRARGHDVIIKENASYIIIYGEQFDISLREKRKRIPSNDWMTRYQPTGELIFSVRLGYVDKMEWIDGKNIPIEHRLSAILAKLEMKSKEEIAWQIEIEKSRQEQREKERIIAELEARRQKELFDLKKMLSDAKRWHESTVLRNYLNNIEDNALSNNILSNELKQKIEWGRKKADWYDPMINADDELLQNIDPNSIIFKKS
jgi:hypothetical protein